MDLDFTPDQSSSATRSAPGSTRTSRPSRVRATTPAIREYDLAWQRTQWDGGWAGIAWPQEYGGRGLTLLQQLIWYEEYAARGFPGMDACFVGSSTPDRP